MEKIVKYFILNSAKVTYGSIILGAFLAMLVGAIFVRPLSMLYKISYAPLALINLVSVLALWLNKNKQPLNTNDVLQQIERGEFSTSKFMRQYGYLMLFYLILMMSLGWLVVGMFFSFIV